MKVLVAGDFCQKNRVDDAVKSKRFGELFDEIKPIVEEADYSIVNFEFPIVLDSSRANPIEKCGPNLKGSIEAVDAVKYAGFKCCTLANNHILDQGEECCLDTKNELEKAGIDTVGVGSTLESAGKILYKQINGETLAIINCCEHEFSIATESSAGANPLNTVQQYYKILEARRNADYVLIIVHGGIEHYQLPTPEMQEIYRYFVDLGADAVVNHHQHCYSGYEIYNGCPIFYGLGNFCFDNNKKDDIWNYGFIVTIELRKNDISKFQLYPYVQCNGDYFLKVEHNKKVFYENLSVLNSIIVDRKKLRQKWEEYEQENRRRYNRIIYPLCPKLFNVIRKCHLLSMSNSYYLFLRAVVQCESHRSRLLSLLKNIK